MVDHDHDEGLCTIDEIAAEAVSNAIKFGAEACVTVSTQSTVKQSPVHWLLEGFKYFAERSQLPVIQGFRICVT